MAEERRRGGNAGPAGGRWGGFALAAAAAVLAAAAAAQPIQLASRFDEDVEGWEAADSDSSVAWSAEQAGTTCDPFSGSTRARHGGPAADSGRNFVPPACVSPVAPITEHTFRAWFRFPPLQDRTGSARLVLVWLTEPNCGGLVASSVDGLNHPTSNGSNWQSTSIVATSPVNARSASLRVRVQKTEADGELDLEFDDVEFVRGRSIFFDSFENGSTCRWSNAVG